jgi:hypothetical protein
MDFIFKNLGPNKVTQQIFSNEFEETNFCVEEVNLFNEIENPIDILRNLHQSKREKGIKQQVDGGVAVAGNQNTSLPTEKVVATAIPSLCDQKNLSGVIRCILSYLDPTTALLTHDTHIEDFKKKLVFSAEMIKKSIVRGLNVKELVANNDITATKYVSFVLKKSIAIKMDGEWLFFGYPEHTECLVMEYVGIVDGGCFSIEQGSPYSVMEVKMRIIKERGTQQKLNTLLVKDLKELALFLDIPVVDSTKKPILKKDLIEAIANHLKVV